MKKTFLRISCLLIALVTVLMTFVACQKGDANEDTQSGVSGGDNVTTNVEETAPVPDKDWGGKPFNVLSVQKSYEPNFEIVGELTGSRVEPAVFRRNLWIKETYNVDIQQYGDADDKHLDILSSQIQAGDTDYDLVFMYRENMASAIQSGYMKDLTRIEHIDLSNDWYNKSTIDSMMISGRLFHMVSDFSLVDKARTNVLFLNRDLAADNNIPDILDMVRDGSWTVDKMVQYEIALSKDLNGDGEMNLSDSWGLACGGREVCSTFWCSLGNESVSVDKLGNWTVNLATDHSVSSIDIVRSMMAPEVSFFENKFGSYSDAMDVFVNKQCLFLSETLSAIEKISPDANFSFTALPYPKYDIEQTQYYTTNDNTFCATFGIPVCASDYTFSGFMVEVLSWQSHTTTYPEYYNVICKVRNSYDEECAEMVDRVFEGLVFDFGLLNGANIKGLRALIENSVYKSTSIATGYDGQKTAIMGYIEIIFDAVAMIDPE